MELSLLNIIYFTIGVYCFISIIILTLPYSTKYLLLMQNYEKIKLKQFCILKHIIGIRFNNGNFKAFSSVKRILICFMWWENYEKLLNYLLWNCRFVCIIHFPRFLQTLFWWAFKFEYEKGQSEWERDRENERGK